MSARAINNEILDFKKEFFEIKENLSFRLFLSLSLGSLFLMGCEEKLAQEPEQAEPVIVTSKEQAEAARDFAAGQNEAGRAHDKEVKGMELDAEKDLAAQEAETARYEADSEIAQAVTEGNARVAQAQVAADGAANEAMMGGLFGVATVGLSKFMEGQIEEKKAAANLREVEAAQVAARMREENQARSLEYQNILEHRRLDLFTNGQIRIIDYLCGGNGERTDDACGTNGDSWKSGMDKALADLATALQSAAEAKSPDDHGGSLEDFRQQQRTEAIENFKQALGALPKQNIDQARAENTERAIEAFLDRVRRGEARSFDLQEIYRADMKAENEALSHRLRMSATRETGVDSTYHAAYRDAPRATETATFR